MDLSDAQQARRDRGEALCLARVDDLLDSVGITKSVALAAADVSPAAREKLKGIINRLRKAPRPFSLCMRDLRKHKPEWSDDRRKKTCAVLKQLAGRSNDGVKTSDGGCGPCVAVDDEVARLVELADTSKLEVAP